MKKKSAIVVENGRVKLTAVLEDSNRETWTKEYDISHAEKILRKGHHKIADSEPYLYRDGKVERVEADTPE
jgi:hypothetical protein